MRLLGGGFNGYRFLHKMKHEYHNRNHHTRASFYGWEVSGLFSFPTVVTNFTDA